MQIVIALLAGVLFGVGLTVSEMINPVRVLGFLDVFGQWDMTLGAVMLGALVVTVPVFPAILRSRKPLLSPMFNLPTRTNIDASLVLGAAIFGVGWGIAGLCPGPAIAGLASGKIEIFYFVAAMVLGQWLVHWLERAK